MVDFFMVMYYSIIMLDDSMTSLSSKSVSSSSPLIPLQIPLTLIFEESFNCSKIWSSLGLKPHRINPFSLSVFNSDLRL